MKVAPKINVSRALSPFVNVSLPSRNWVLGAVAGNAIPVNLSSLAAGFAPHVMSFDGKPLNTAVFALSINTSLLGDGPGSAVSTKVPDNSGSEKRPVVEPAGMPVADEIL